MVNDIRRLALMCDPLSSVERSPDPDDDWLLVVAEKAQEDYLATGDKNMVEITTTSTQALKDAASVWRHVEAGDEGIVPTIGFGSPSELFAAITDRRLELLRHVASHDVANIHQLAQALGRDYKNAHTDVKELEELGLLERADGKLVAPFDEMNIRVALREAT